MPTVLDLVGAPPLAGADGRSLRPVRRAASGRSSDPASYFEALNANLTRHWAPLTGLVCGGAQVHRPAACPSSTTSRPIPASSRTCTRRSATARATSSARLVRAAARRRPAAPAAVDAEPQAACARSATSSRRRTREADLHGRRRSEAARPPQRGARRCRRRCGRAATPRARSKRFRRSIAERRRPHRRLRSAGVHAARDRAGRRGGRGARRGGARRPCRPAARCARSASMLRDAGDLQRSAAVLEPLVRDDAVGSAGRRRARPDLREDGTRSAGRGDVQARAGGVAEHRGDVEQPRRAATSPRIAPPTRSRRCRARSQSIPISPPPTTASASPTRGWDRCRARGRAVEESVGAASGLRRRPRQPRARIPITIRLSWGKRQARAAAPAGVIDVNSSLSSASRPTYLAAASAVFTLVLGVAVLAGWFLHIPALVQILPHLPPMTRNRGRVFPAVWPGPAVPGRRRAARGWLSPAREQSASLSLLTILEFIFNVNAGIDELLGPSITFKLSSPGRMSPVAAVCFSLVRDGADRRPRMAAVARRHCGRV